MKGVYSNLEIIDAIDNGQIVQYPSAPELINGSSVDVRLGYYYYRTDVSTEHPGFYNPYSEGDVKRYFGDVLTAKPLAEYDEQTRSMIGGGIENIDPDHPLIVLRPGERILGHTHEFIGIRGQGTSSMQAKSTTGRNGVTVCKDAGWGDPGYINRWTMEIENSNEREYIALPVGMRIAQMVFYHTGDVQSDYSKLSGNYQTSTDLDELIRTWEPSQMLPRAYKSVVTLPERISQGTYL